MGDRDFITDENKAEWINRQEGNDALLIVKGALLVSPCSLQTNQISPQVLRSKSSFQVLIMSGCDHNIRLWSNGKVNWLKSNDNGIEIINQQTDTDISMQSVNLLLLIYK